MCVGHDEAGGLVFNGVDRALRADPTADVVDLGCDHVDDIMARGGRTWLDDHRIERGFTSY